MPSQEHVHIITAGEDIAATYTASFRDYPGITRTYVFSDSTLYFRHADPEIEKSRFAVRNAISAAKNTSTSIAIPFSNEVISAPAYPAVRDTLTRIHREHPGARYTFDLSGGSKPLCMALLALAPWVNGEIRSAFDEKVPRPVPLPDLPSRAMLENPNYQTILAILLRCATQEKGTKKENTKGTPIPAQVSRQYLFGQLGSVYIPLRTKMVPQEDSSVQAATAKKSRAPVAAALTHGTFSDFMGALLAAGLVEETEVPENKREKFYRITIKGEFAFRFFSDPSTGTLVRMMLEQV